MTKQIRKDSDTNRKIDKKRTKTTNTERTQTQMSKQAHFVPGFTLSSLEFPYVSVDFSVIHLFLVGCDDNCRCTAHTMKHEAMDLSACEMIIAARKYARCFHINLFEKLLACANFFLAFKSKKT